MEFKYLGILLTSDSKMERETNRRLVQCWQEFGVLYRTIVVTKKQSWKAKFFIYHIYFPTLTYSHELWIVTDRMRYKRPKLVSSVGWLVSALEIG